MLESWSGGNAIRTLNFSHFGRENNNILSSYHNPHDNTTLIGNEFHEKLTGGHNIYKLFIQDKINGKTITDEKTKKVYENVSEIIENRYFYNYGIIDGYTIENTQIYKICVKMVPHVNITENNYNSRKKVRARRRKSRKYIWYILN